jgi:AraC family transcriptional activator of pobA
MKSVRNFALYGTTETQPGWADLVHFERIPDRSSLFDWEIDLHTHDALIQLLYVTRGGGTASIDGQRWPIDPPCLVVVPAGAVHGFSFRSDMDGPVVTAAQKPLESLATTAAPELLQVIRTPRVLPVDVHGRHAQALLPLFDAIAREAQVHAPGQVAAGMALLVALFVQIARIGESAPREDRPTRSRKAVQIERFRALLDERFRRREPVRSYADALGITLGQLTRLCREVLGLSVQDVVNARVIHEAQRELVYSTLAIKQVAAELGFDDEAYFGRFFKKHTGYRPTEFRAMAHAQLAAA